jgi:hypothetical protein
MSRHIHGRGQGGEGGVAADCVRKVRCCDLAGRSVNVTAVLADTAAAKLRGVERFRADRKVVLHGTIVHNSCALLRCSELRERAGVISAVGCIVTATGGVGKRWIESIIENAHVRPTIRRAGHAPKACAARQTLGRAMHRLKGTRATLDARIAGCGGDHTQRTLAAERRRRRCERAYGTRCTRGGWAATKPADNNGSNDDAVIWGLRKNKTKRMLYFK